MVSLTFSLTACSSVPKKPDVTTVQLLFAASKNLNPDLKNRASPAQVSVVGLRKINAFLGADYFSLSEAGKNALGGDISSKESFVIEPGESLRKSYSADADDVAVGIVVGFRDMEHSVWRASAVLPVPPKKAWLHMPDFGGGNNRTFEYHVVIDDKSVRLDASTTTK